VIRIHAGGEAGYKAIVDAFGAYQIGDYGRIIMYNPCQKKLPPMVIFVAPTCNRFDKEYVDRQWRCVSRICNVHLGHVVGTVPCVAMNRMAIAGAAACSRRRC
jgi:hypothetical protein